MRRPGANRDDPSAGPHVHLPARGKGSAKRGPLHAEAQHDGEDATQQLNHLMSRLGGVFTLHKPDGSGRGPPVSVLVMRCQEKSDRHPVRAADHRRTRRSSWAFTATMMVLKDISTAPTAGVRMMPHGASTPAASGIATML